MISLPLMNNLCKRWTLPSHIQKDCDLYFLRNLSDQDFVQSVKLSADGNDLLIQEYGINFIVIFQHGADKVYTRNGELAKRNEPNNTNYWCSFRSITFNWQGVPCTKSYVLVQVDKGNHSTLDSTRERPVGTPREPLQKNEPIDYGLLHNRGIPLAERSTGLSPAHAAPYGSCPKKSFTSFAERSQPIERLEQDEED